MNLSDDRVVDDQIRKLVSDSAPLPVESRLRSQLADFRSRLSTPEPAMASYVRGWARAAEWWRLGATCAAAVVLVASIALLFRPQTSFAQVQAAVLRQPWIHLRTVFADQSVSEGWFSPATDIAASRGRGSIRYEDYRLQVYHSYDPEEQVVYRAPIAQRTSPASQFESIGGAIKILLQGNGLPKKPFAHLGFLGSERDKMTVVDQRVDKVTEQKQTWLDYRLTVKHTDLADPVRVLFRVNTHTKLPQLCRVEAVQNGKPATFEMQFDYPEKGPADIYELGVPKTAKFVNRVPAGDLKLIIETLQAGRERMDNYRAVFVHQIDGPDHKWWTAIPDILYRKGDRYRRDLMGGWIDKVTERPAADVDRRQWWFERAKHFRYYPVDVQRGATKYTCMTEGPHNREIATVHKYVDNSKPGEMFPVDYAMRPEFVCRPPMGIGNPHLEPALDLHPVGGPPGCILLTVTHTSKKDRANGWEIEPANMDHFWLDPQRDYIALRWEMVTRAGTGEEIISSQHIVEETARSPQGVWYATRVRLKNAAGNGKEYDQIYNIYVDFGAELPDALFDVPTPGRIE